MTYIDNLRFKNHKKMRDDLIAAGEVDPPAAEAELVHLYDITFLVGRYDLVEESRRYMPNGTRKRTVR